MTAFYIEGVVHGACGVIFGRVERCEVEPIGFNFGALCHFEAHGTKNLFNAF
jgi:hypothetical protein